jgi:hypothetical protein
MNLTQEQYDKLLADVEKEFSTLLAKAEEQAAQPLAKAEEAKSEEVKEEIKSEASEQQLEKAEDKEEEKKEEKEEEKKDEEKKEDGEHCDYDDEDKEEMHKMYHSMSKGELKAHKDTVEKCWMAKCGEMQVMKSEEQSKTETLAKPEEANKEVELLKSESESLKKENESLKKNIEQLTAAMTSFITKKAPERKAVTDIGFIAKSEESKEETLSKAEIDKILSKKATDQSLSKGDRDLIKNYYLSGAPVETVRHLLK